MKDFLHDLANGLAVFAFCGAIAWACIGAATSALDAQRAAVISLR